MTNQTFYRGDSNDKKDRNGGSMKTTLAIIIAVSILVGLKIYFLWH